MTRLSCSEDCFVLSEFSSKGLVGASGGVELDWTASAEGKGRSLLLSNCKQQWQPPSEPEMDPVNSQIQCYSL